MNAQEILWSVPSDAGALWWLGCAVLALPAALIVFVRSIMNHPIAPATICKFLHVCSLVAVAAVWMNSGWIPWAIGLTAVNGFLWALLPFWNRLWDRVATARHRAYAHTGRRHGLGD